MCCTMCISPHNIRYSFRLLPLWPPPLPPPSYSHSLRRRGAHTFGRNVKKKTFFSSSSIFSVCFIFQLRPVFKKQKKKEEEEKRREALHERLLCHFSYSNVMVSWWQFYRRRASLLLHLFPPFSSLLISCHFRLTRSERLLVPPSTST